MKKQEGEGPSIAKTEDNQLTNSLNKKDYGKSKNRNEWLKHTAKD